MKLYASIIAAAAVLALAALVYAAPAELPLLRDIPTTEPVEPGTLFLFGVGLLGLSGLSRIRKG